MLSVENIDLHYGAAQALRSVSLTAETGKIACVMGRNGVGKTSLMRAIVGQKSASRGRILWNGEDVTALAPFERARRGIALVPQGREIFPLLTVEENLRTGFAPLERARHTIPDDVFSLFPVLAQMLRRRGGDLSGGQQQQLAIGRALVLNPTLLILDEPTEGIQPNVVHEIGDVLLRLNRDEGLTILLVEQKLPFARRVASDFSVLEKGRVVASGPIEGLSDDVVKNHLTV